MTKRLTQNEIAIRIVPSLRWPGAVIERGFDPAVPRLFIIDGSKALAKAIRRSFGRHMTGERVERRRLNLVAQVR